METNKDKRIADLEAALTLALRYLDHPEVQNIPFALPVSSVVSKIQGLLK